MFTNNRKNGFIDAHRKHKLPFEEASIIETGLMINDGERVMEKLINEKNIPEAIFAVNDPTAIGAMKMLKKYGFKIPADVALVGFTESKLAELIDPPLTSVAQPTKEIGRTAAMLLLEQIENKRNFCTSNRNPEWAVKCAGIVNEVEIKRIVRTQFILLTNELPQKEIIEQLNFKGVS